MSLIVYCQSCYHVSLKVPKGQKVREDSSVELQTRIGSVIKSQRLRLGVTQEELAWRADMHRTYLADIERGGRNITLRSIVSLAQALQISIESLVSQENTTRQVPARLGEILLVEDNAEDAALTLRAFKQARLSNPVKVVRTGKEALDYINCRRRYARRHATTPQIVLLDLNLPDMSGLDVLRALKARKETRQIPVVVLTVSRDDRNIMECSRLGAENYIIKPVEFASFSKITSRLNFRWALMKVRIATARPPV